jgi:AcrR family transcriptional regulator
MGPEVARTPLSRDRVLRGALDLADEIGVEAFTMRKLADALGVRPMSIYHHVAGKEQILDGMVDLVFGEIDLPPEDLDWTDAIRRRCVSARAVLNRHPWAPPLMESRASPGPATLRHHDAVIACLRRGGLSYELTTHAYAIVDSYVYGFALQEASLPFGGDEAIGEVAEQIVDAVPHGEYPHLVEFTVNTALQPGYSFGRSFEFGLDLIIEGLDRALDAEVGR